MKIQILPSEVVDQIAAGEVVERPSHLIKELVENSLDAGSSEIIVDFSMGGRFVKIIDNGAGISAEDLPKAFIRFATSKIYSIADLWRLNSFGFRGEALASISSVSLMTLFSSDNSSGSGFRVNCNFGKIGHLEPVSRSRGTTVIVEELFQNIPARLKFMKSEGAESSQIKSVLKAIAISRPDVSFRVLQDNKLLHFWPSKKNWKERVEDILDITPMYEGTAVRGSVRCRSFFGSPEETAKTSRMIWLFAQGRYIQDRSMQAAVMEAYRNLLMQGEFPVVASFIETEPDQIDVNIHPTKSQVKFLSSQDTFRAVQASIRDVLEKAPWLEVQKNTWSSFAYTKENQSVHNHDNKIEAKVENNFVNIDLNPLVPFQENTQENLKQSDNYREPEVSFRANKSDITQPRNLTFDDPAFQSTLFRKREFSSDNMLQDVVLTLTDLEKKKLWSHLDVIGQAGLTYILCQSKTSLVLIDQHAAHERVVFEKLIHSIKNGGLEVQKFLFPLAIDLNEDKLEALKSCITELAKMGIELEELGPSTIGIKSAPTILKDQVVVREIHRFSQEILDRGVSFSFEKTIGDICASMACHSVVRAGESLSLNEMKNLLEEMDQFPLSCYCPHGRPVSVEIPWVKLEKDFGRIVT
jgi:DNA mismatch repair protein MutL